MDNVMPDNSVQDKTDGEEPILFHILKMQERRAARTIQKVHDPLGNILESPKDIIHNFVRHLREKY